MFRSVATALTGSEDEPTPAAKRRRGETEGELRKPAHVPTANDNGRPAARGRFAMLQPAKAEKATDAVVPDATYVNATAYLSDTLEWLQLWQDNATASQWLDDDFSAKQQDQYFPQP